MALFECSDRIGGRLLSLTPPGMPHIRCELGGMRFESIHTYVNALIRLRCEVVRAEPPRREEVPERSTQALPARLPSNSLTPAP